MLPTTPKHAPAQVTVAPNRDFSAGRPASEAQRARLNPSTPSRPGLVEIDLDIVSVRFFPWRNGLGRVISLIVAHPEYKEAVCLSGELPFGAAPGQKVRIRGRRREYQGKPQIEFERRDIALIVASD
jgi:hypothetical protein